MNRLIVGILCAALLAGPLVRAAWAVWPQDRPITLIVPFPVESSSDKVARLLADHLQQKLKQTVVVRNIPGGGGKFGFAALAQSEPDGYTVGMLSSPRYLSFLLEPNAGYSFESFEELAGLTSDASVLLVREDSPFQTVRDVIGFARIYPGALRYATSGVGTEEHLAANMLASELNLHMVHEPFSSTAQAVEALLQKRVPLLFCNASETRKSLEELGLRSLGQFADERSRTMPLVPTLREMGYEMVMTSVRGVVMPAGGDPAVVQKWVKTLGEVGRTPEFFLAFQELGLTLQYHGPNGFCAKLVLAKAEFESACYRFP